MPTSRTTTHVGPLAVTSIYSWGGNMDHSETLVTCQVCGDSCHSDFGPDDFDPAHHGVGICEPAEPVPFDIPPPADADPF